MLIVVRKDMSVMSFLDGIKGSFQMFSQPVHRASMSGKPKHHPLEVRGSAESARVCSKLAQKVARFRFRKIPLLGAYELLTITLRLQCRTCQDSPYIEGELS